METRQKKSEYVVNLGLYSNILLAVLKTIIGIVGHSSALLADGINSTSDVVYYVVVKVFLRLAGKPADAEHPYGHSQLESIAALIVGSFVITTAVAIFWEAANQAFDLYFISNGHGMPISSIALIVALVTIIAKCVLTVITGKIGRETGNAAVVALAYDHRNDIFSATAAAVGIIGGRLGFTWCDPFAGAVVALVVLRTGIKIIRESSAELMDDVPGGSLDKDIRELIAGMPGAVAVEEVSAHRFGPYLVINLIIGVDGNMTVHAGDEIASAIERGIITRFELVRRVYVHYHPRLINR